MRQYKRTISKKSLIIIIFILSVALIAAGTSLVKALIEFRPDSILSPVISAIETAALIATLIIAIWQLSQSTNISRATFISDLNKAYVENKEYVDVYDKLQACLDASDGEIDKCMGSKEKCKDRCNPDETCKLNLPKSQVSNYLTFFETIYILHNSGVISFEIMDDLFAYRFFLAIHSKYFQMIKLGKKPENFKNIFCLEREWLAWRRKNGKDDKRDENNNIIPTIYNTLLLESLVGEEKYNELTKGCTK